MVPLEPGFFKYSQLFNDQIAMDVLRRANPPLPPMRSSEVGNGRRPRDDTSGDWSDDEGSGGRGWQGAPPSTARNLSPAPAGSLSLVRARSGHRAAAFGGDPARTDAAVRSLATTLVRSAGPRSTTPRTNGACDGYEPPVARNRGETRTWSRRVRSRGGIPNEVKRGKHVPDSSISTCERGNRLKSDEHRSPRAPAVIVDSTHKHDSSRIREHRLPRYSMSCSPPCREHSHTELRTLQLNNDRTTWKGAMSGAVVGRSPRHRSWRPRPATGSASRARGATAAAF
ncbi:hypothetical protein BV20DRAFT_527681 [Pilatotrama ljubarskyi]|nr:hypothetical protein BV20DRAFT_527681 [Pilatotrama ljubarskyi]